MACSGSFRTGPRHRIDVAPKGPERACITAPNHARPGGRFSFLDPTPLQRGEGCGVVGIQGLVGAARMAGRERFHFRKRGGETLHEGRLRFGARCCHGIVVRQRRRDDLPEPKIRATWFRQGVASLHDEDGGQQLA